MTSSHVRYDSHADRVQAILEGAAMDGLVHGAEFVLTESRAVVPLDEATLERSGAVTQDRVAGKVAISYDTAYAVVQHENLEYRHAPGRTAKYLELPAIEHRETVRKIVETKVRRALRDGGG